MICKVEGWIVSPRKSRKKSLCRSSRTVLTPARANRNPSMIPAGPPPAMQHVVCDAFTSLTRCAGGPLEGEPVAEPHRKPMRRIGHRALRRIARERDPALAMPRRHRHLDAQLGAGLRRRDAEYRPGKQHLGRDARLVGAEIHRLGAGHGMAALRK